MRSAVSQYAFYFDASACSGCKACQVACMDKHGLEAGRTWRQVYEISGGSWEQTGEAWVPDVFAYHISLACNHCDKPICAEVCPSNAITKRFDGIVLIDVEKCLGCGYCSWACPYAALDYNKGSGHMTKCTFCVERIDEGRSPECVAACPMRVLDFGDQETLTVKYGSTNGSYPLPEPDLTEPQFLVNPHRDSQRPNNEPAEVTPSAPLDMKERPLIGFTLLSQLAAGTFLALVILDALSFQTGQISYTRWVTSKTLFGITLLMIASMLVSLFHLGTPQTAYRAFSNLKTSWLSREIFFAATFGGLLVLLSVVHWLDFGASFAQSVIAWAAALTGMLLVYCMSRVYMLRTVPVWNSPHIPLSFFITTLMLGELAAIVAITNWPESSTLTTAPEGIKYLIPIVSQWLALSLFGLLVIDMLVTFVWWANFDPPDSGPRQSANTQERFRYISGLRMVLTFLGISIMGTFLYQYSADPIPVIQLSTLAWLSFGLVLVAKIIGRYLFYKSYIRSGL